MDCKLVDRPEEVETRGVLLSQMDVCPSRDRRCPGDQRDHGRVGVRVKHCGWRLEELLKRQRFVVRVSAALVRGSSRGERNRGGCAVRLEADRGAAGGRLRDVLSDAPADDGDRKRVVGQKEQVTGANARGLFGADDQ